MGNVVRSEKEVALDRNSLDLIVQMLYHGSDSLDVTPRSCDTLLTLKISVYSIAIFSKRKSFKSFLQLSISERQKLDKFIKGGEDEAIIKKEDESGDGDGEESGDGDDDDNDDDSPDYKNDDSGDGTDDSGEGDDDDDAPDYKNDDSGDGTDDSGEGDDDDDAPDYKNDDSGDGTDESGEGDDDDDAPDYKNDDSGDGTDESGEGDDDDDDDDYPESQYYGSIAGEITENGDAAYGDSIKNELPSFDDPQRVASHFSRLAEIARKGKLSLKARDSIEDKLIDALLTEYETKGKY